MPMFQSSTATADEFWFSPALKYAVPVCRDNDVSNTTTTAIGDCAVDRHDDDSMAIVLMPPAHDQLLSRDRPSSEALKGYDHAQADAIDDDGNLDGYCYSGDVPSGHRQKLTTVKQQGGGSWLMGSLANLNRNAEGKTTPPGLVRVSSDDDSSTASSCTDEVSLPFSHKKGVSFAPTVAIQPIPHSSTLSLFQRRRMYATSLELRKNRARNAREFRYDGCDWRTATEERDMHVDMVTGEAVHPVHDYS